MKLLKGLLSQAEDPLRARFLLNAANINGVTAYVTIAASFPVVREATREHWDFILTVAGVFAGLHKLQSNNAPKKDLMAIVTDALSKWNADAMSAIEDCGSLFEREVGRLITARHDARFVATDALGLWIVTKALGRQPETFEEGELLRAVGILVMQAFSNWWTR